MIENRWLIYLSKSNLYKNSVKFPGKFLEEWDSAAARIDWLYGENNCWQDTHIYTWKQIHERVMRAVELQEERAKKYRQISEDDLENESD